MSKPIHINLRINQDELEFLDGLAQKLGISRSAAVRKWLDGLIVLDYRPEHNSIREESANDA